MRIRKRFIAALLLGTSAPGCVTVQPWERERLSHPCMAPQARLGDGFRNHVLPIREGTVGGEGSAGGGCGCN